MWPRFAPQLMQYTGFALTVNYGTEKVRFPSPVPVGARLRAKAVLESVSEVGPGVIQTLQTGTFEVEVEGVAKPALVATIVLRHYV
jgi:acyl dehydratase